VQHPLHAAHPIQKHGGCHADQIWKLLS